MCMTGEIMETRQHVARMQGIMGGLSADPQTWPCSAVTGLVQLHSLSSGGAQPPHSPALWQALRSADCGLVQLGQWGPAAPICPAVWKRSCSYRI